MALEQIIRNKFDLMSAINILKELSVESDHVLKFQPVKRKRTLDQNALIWVWCSVIEKETGQNRNDVYYEMEDRYSPTKVYTKHNGNVAVRKLRIKELDTKQFNTLLEEMKDFCLRFFNVELIWPDDYRRDLFYEEVCDE